MFTAAALLKRNGLYDKVVELLKANEIEMFELSGVEPNPRHTTANRGAEICKKENIDVVLAVGGGSDDRLRKRVLQRRL